MPYLREILLIGVLAVIMLGNLYDFIVDFSRGASALHLFEEGGIIVISTGLILWLFSGIRRQRQELEQMRRELAGRRQPEARPAHSVVEARRRLGDAIREQFQAWKLTGSEQEVGLLLLKGLSFKEIAALRQTREKTVRAQASSIYQKAGVSGRHAFSAWFIEDIL